MVRYINQIGIYCNMVVGSRGSRGSRILPTGMVRDNKHGEWTEAKVLDTVLAILSDGQT